MKQQGHFTKGALRLAPADLALSACNLPLPQGFSAYLKRDLRDEDATEELF